MENHSYSIKIKPLETENGMVWMASYEELKGCIGGGKSEVEAINDLKGNLNPYLEAMVEQGLPIPKPRDTDIILPSGKISLRVSKSTHAKLLEQSAKNGVSLNAYINEAVSEKIGSTNVLSIIAKRIDEEVTHIHKSYGSMSYKVSSGK